MSSLNLKLSWSPTAKGRPRISSRTLPNGKTFARAYTPAKTRDAEAGIRWLILELLRDDGRGVPVFGSGVPLRVHCTFFVVRPKSIPKKRIYPVTRPDLDNYQKLLSDAANGYLWVDDSQIVQATMEKRYALPDQAGYMEIEVADLAE